MKTILLIAVILTTLVVITATRKVRYDPQVSSTSTRILIETPKQEIEMEVTAYNLVPEQTDYSPTIGAWGDDLTLEPPLGALWTKPAVSTPTASIW